MEYKGFGFTTEPETQEEYFRVLEGIDSIDRLMKSQQAIARKVFLYIQRYSYTPFSWGPETTYEEERGSELDSYYWRSIIDLYAQESGRLFEEFWKYVTRLREAEFSNLSRLRYPI